SACAVGFVWAVIFHMVHNGMQALLGPFTQVATALGLLAPLYLIAKAARRRAADDGVDFSKQIFGDLHAMTISIATLFLAAAVLFSRTAGRTARLMEDQAALANVITALDSAKTVAAVNKARQNLLSVEFTSGDPDLPKLRDPILAA